MKKLVKIICIAFAVLMVAAIPLSAAKPYQTYTYSISGTALYSPNAYDPLITVDYKYMGLDKKIEDPRDLEVDEDENVYIVDTKTNRVICYDGDKCFDMDIDEALLMQKGLDEEIFVFRCYKISYYSRTYGNSGYE